MASPPFDLDTSHPANNDAESIYPANERAFRDNVESYIGWEHDIDSGHHKFMELSDTARDAITDWPEGAMIWNTDSATAQMFISATWVDLGPVTDLQPKFLFITASGTFLINRPSLIVHLIGGGGGGAGGTNDPSTPGGGGGGGAGAYVVYYLYGLTVGESLSIVIGGAGAFGSSGLPGSAGGTTQLSNGTQVITTATAGGGAGGQAGLGPNLGGSAGTPSGGVVNQVILLTGGDGGAGYNVSSTFGLPGKGGTIASSMGGFGFGGDGGYATTVTGINGANGIQGACMVQWFE